MKRHILTFIALALALIRVQADDISVPDVTIVPGTAAQVGISLDNTETNLVSFQMDLTLPEGISINKNDCSLSNRFTDEDQELTIGKQGDNVYRLTSTSFAMTPLSGTSGEIITLSLSASESATGGTATLSNIRFVTSNSERVTLDDVTFSISVSSSDVIQLMGQPWEARYQFVENWENATDPMDGDTPWYSPDFNDSAWLTLTGPLDGNNWNAEYSAYYLRRTFTLNEVKDGYYLIHANHDDHVKIYLNGSFVGDKPEDGTHDMFIPSSLLQEGENILAIYIDDNRGVDRCLDYDFHYLGDGMGPDIYVDEQGIVYQREEGCYSVRGRLCNFGASSIVIPGELFDLPVTSIGTNSFYCCPSLTSVTLPESVTSIGHIAFGGCGSLSSVNIPEGVTFIDGWAFSTCVLTSITIPASVTGIGVGAFNQCPLTVVTTNMAVPCEIAAETFTNRANAVLFVPAGCKEVYEEADYWKEFKLIADVSEDILLSGEILPWEMKYVFRESCEDLQEPEADSNENPWYAAEYDDSAWETLTGPMARDAERFSQVNYPWETPGSCYFLRRKFQMDAVREGFYEIHGICDDNMDVYLNGHKIFKTEFEGFNWSFRVPSLFLHEGENMLAIFAADDGGGEAYLDYSMHFLQEDEIIEFADPDVEEICCNSYWFDSNGDGHLSKVEAASVESLMDSFMAHEESVLETFDSFDELQYFTGLTTLNALVFLNCKNLSSIIIPESVKSILSGAFGNCSSLTSITIPASVTSIESDAFSGCSGLTSVTFLGNALGDRQHFVNIFSGCPDDILFNIPEGTAGSYLRRGFKNLSDKSGLPLVREVFEAEATRISAMAEEVSDGDKTALASAIEEARVVVANTDDYMAVYAQIVAVKSAAKTFLTTATLPQDFDVTAATITNPDFDLLDIGWKVDNIAENIGRLDEEGINHWENGDVVMDNFIEAYQTGRALGDGNISQTITNLPAGTYRFEADIIASNEYDASAEVTGVCLFAGENMSSSVSTEFRKPQHISFTFENPTTCDVTVGINITGTNANWVAADNFRLYNMVQEEVEVTDISQLDNVIYIEPFVENKGNRDDISIKMKNSAEIRGFQFELVLPEGITPVEEDDVILCGLNPDRSPKNSLGTLYHTIEAKRQDDGSYRILCGSQQDKTFLGNDGEIAKLYVNVSPDMATGDYPIILRNIKLSETDISHFYQVEEVVTKLTIVDIIGDINGDKTVDVSDYIGVANHILGNTPSGFNYNAADVNRDGAIDVSDYIGIANIILTGSIYGNRNATTRSLNNNEEVRNPQ